MPVEHGHNIGLLIFNFIYLSLVIQTTTGYGDIHPTGYARISVMIQELVSMLYFCVILGLGLAHIYERSFSQPPSHEASTTNSRLRNASSSKIWNATTFKGQAEFNDMAHNDDHHELV